MFRVSCYKVTMDEEKLMYELDFTNQNEAENFANKRGREYESQYSNEDYENGFENPYCLFIKEI